MPITKGEFEGGGKPDPSVRVVAFLKSHRDEGFTLTEIYSALAEEGEEIDFDTIDAGLRLAVQDDIVSLTKTPMMGLTLRSRDGLVRSAVPTLDPPR